MPEDVKEFGVAEVSKSVVVTSRKGGVGKTAIAATLASVIANDGYSVLLVDLDAQSLAALALSADPLLPGAAHWLSTGEHWVQEPQPRLRLLAGGPELDRIATLDASTFRKALSTISADLVIFDTPAGFGSLSRSAVAAVDVALVVTEPHPLGLAGAATMLNALDRKMQRALVVSKVDHRRALHRDISQGASIAFSGETLFLVHQDLRIERALAEGTPLATIRHSKALNDIRSIAKWLMEGRVNAEVKT